MELVALHELKFKIWAVPRQALQQCFSFFPLFYFSDNFNFKILINYSKVFDCDCFFYYYTVDYI